MVAGAAIALWSGVITGELCAAVADPALSRMADTVEPESKLESSGAADGGASPARVATPPRAMPPAMKLLRYEEDYFYLRDPSLRLDVLDPLKYIALDPGDPSVYLSLGGELRERYEYTSKPRFGLTTSVHDDSLLQRVLLHTDLHLGPSVRVFVQGISAFQWGQAGGTSPTNTNVADLQQGFAEVTIGDVEGYRLGVRAGRQEISFGSSRLVATRESPNVHFTHDGGRATLKVGDLTVDAFATRLVNPRKYQFDDWASGQDFWGVYATQMIGGVLKGIDLYYLGYHNGESVFNGRTAGQVRHTFGTRLFGKAEAFEFDTEFVGQFGEFGGDEIRAWTASADLGYRLDELPLRPRLGLKADIASGGTDSRGGTNRTFDPLFFKAGYFNDASLIRPSNIMDLHPTVQLAPLESVTLTLGYNWLWRYSVTDAIYDPPGRVSIRGEANASRFIGSTAEASAEWKIHRYLTLSAAYVHLFRGGFIKDAGGHDVDYAGVWLTFKF